MIRSMTGFGRATARIGDRFELTVSAKSVNHRYLEVSVRLPEWLWDFENVVRSLAGEFFKRGKIDVSIRVRRTSDPAYDVRLNRDLAARIIPAMQSLSEELGLTSRPSLSDVIRIPDVLVVDASESEADDSEREAMKTVVRDAFAQMQEMRASEGRALAADVQARVESIDRQRKLLLEERPAVVEEQLAAYRERVAEIAGQAGVELNHDRLAQETVILVEKGDVAEELTRLEIHIREIARLVGKDTGEGKRLDFLAQEMLREINTIGSKSRSARIRSAVVELKTEAERIREQVQNVE
jgi:uncharacterized protein (TIGR00255 family)